MRAVRVTPAGPVLTWLARTRTSPAGVGTMMSTGDEPTTLGTAVPPMLRLSTLELPPATELPAWQMDVCWELTAPTAIGTMPPAVPATLSTLAEAPITPAERTVSAFGLTAVSPFWGATLTDWAWSVTHGSAWA